MGHELILILLIQGGWLDHKDLIKFARTCRVAYNLSRTSLRCQVQRVVNHIANSVSAADKDCLWSRHGSVTSDMRVTLPRVRRFDNWHSVTVFERSLLVYILCNLFSTWSARVINFQSVWSCTVNQHTLLPTTLPNEDGRLRFSQHDEYLLLVRTHLLSSEIMCITWEHERSGKYNADVGFTHFDIRLMTRLNQSKHGNAAYLLCVDFIMTQLGFDTLLATKV